MHRSPGRKNSSSAAPSECRAPAISSSISVLERLSEIDAARRCGHFFLEDADRCFFYGEYYSGEGDCAGPINRLIHNLKIKPTSLARRPSRRKYKERAIHQAAAALARLAGDPVFIHEATFVPVPPSKTPGHPDHCDRLARALHLGLDVFGADIRDVFLQTQDTRADHEAGARMSKEELAAITVIDERALRVPLRGTVVVFDDVITSGKHFKVCQECLRRRAPDRQVIGLFIARCVRRA